MIMSELPADTAMINHWVLLSGYIITFLIGLPSNILAMYAFIRKLGNNPTPTDVLLLNLSISDLLFLAFLPLKMYEAALGLRWNLTVILCSIMSFVFFTTIYTSSLLLMAIAIDRYLGVAFPFIYRKHRKIVYSIIGSVVIWLVSGAHCTTVFVVVYMTEQNSTEPFISCYENFDDSQKNFILPVRIVILVLMCLVPLLVSIFCYYRCIWILYHKPQIAKEKTRRAIGMAVGTLSVFLVLFLPYNISHLVGYITNNSPSWRYYALILTTFNTCLDPIIFYFYSATYRNTAKISFWRIFSFCRGTGMNCSATVTVKRETSS